MDARRCSVAISRIKGPATDNWQLVEIKGGDISKQWSYVYAELLVPLHEHI